VELGIPLDGARLREFVGGALDNAGLPVAKASASVGISAGQARLRDINIQSDGADLQATVNVSLADAMLDALLTLNAPAQAAGAAQPAVMVALKGPLPSPARAVDTSLLGSWLTLRAVERQSKQLDAMERAARAARDAAAAQSPSKPDDVKEQPALPPASAVPAAPSNANGIPGALQSPPVTIPAAPKPRAAPRTDGLAPLRSSGRPNLLGAQN
jgi:hypothetical protein